MGNTNVHYHDCGDNFRSVYVKTPNFNALKCADFCILVILQKVGKITKLIALDCADTRARLSSFKFRAPYIKYHTSCTP